MRFENFKPILLILLLLPFAFSCTPYKSVPYLQDVRRDSVVSEKIGNLTPFTVQPGDLLGVHVVSLNHDLDAVVNYNLDKPQENSVKNVDRAEQTNVVGYAVDDDGVIRVPYIGPIKVGGLTTFAIAKILETKLSTYLGQPNVNVRLLNFKISVLGDVKLPGVFNIANERITIFEALGLAADLNTTGLRKVLLIRELDGVRQTVPIDLQSKDLLKSPYYYLKNNDVIYVQPNKDKVLVSDSAIQRVSILISAMSLLAIFFTRK